MISKAVAQIHLHQFGRIVGLVERTIANEETGQRDLFRRISGSRPLLRFSEQPAVNLLIPDCYAQGGHSYAEVQAKRKQLNIGITPDQYEAVRIAAEEEGRRLRSTAVQAIMEKAAPEPEIPDVTGLPTWLIHFLLFISRGKTRPAYAECLAGLLCREWPEYSGWRSPNC